MSDCIFCKIARGEVLSEKIYEDDKFVAFKDINPVGEGHTLIIPKKHFDNLMEMDDKNSSGYINAIKEVGKILMKRHNADGLNIVLNNGEVAGQVVGHVHFHILPRKKGDKKRGIFIG